MKDAKIVVGCGWGDEGKGLTVDNLCKRESLVVRFSGGQQAGHTVMRDGKKHVFSNFGAGTLQGKSTYFTEHTSIYLNTLVNEKAVLNNLGINPTLFVHPLAMMTTPYDVLWNRLTEAINQHGSCGLGVAATMKRNIETPYKLYAIDFVSDDKTILKEKLQNIQNNYNRRYKEFININSDKADILEKVVRDWIPMEERFIQLIDDKLPFWVIDFPYIRHLFEDFIFEGSQGIMLDMDHGVFPNVTYGNTTSKNALSYCQRYDLLPEIYYVTRCYQTRHGNGFMTSPGDVVLVNNEEEINVLNQYQGRFRIGEIDYSTLNHALRCDQIYHGEWEHREGPIKKNMVITCLDQRPGFEFNYDAIFGDKVNQFYLNNSPKCGNMIKVK
jgi:adenylosuccinate synthase